MVTCCSAPRNGQPRTWEGLVQQKFGNRESELCRSNPSLARESATPLCVLDMWNTFEAPVKEELMMWVYVAALQYGMSKWSRHHPRCTSLPMRQPLFGSSPPPPCTLVVHPLGRTGWSAATRRPGEQPLPRTATWCIMSVVCFLMWNRTIKSHQECEQRH
jgi:hypothetical protein